MRRLYSGRDNRATTNEETIDTLYQINDGQDEKFETSMKATKARQMLRSTGNAIQAKNSQRDVGNTTIVDQNNRNEAPLGAVLPRLAKRKTNVSSEDVSPRDSSTKQVEKVEVKMSQRPSLLLEKSMGLGQFESMRTVDIQTDSNSAASQAFTALKNSRPNSGNFGDVQRKVEGREIRQDHELYGMTYGMMLGIRVLTGRREMFSMGAGKGDTNSVSSNSRVLTEEDYDYELELDFPPEGSKEKAPKSKGKIYETPPHKLAQSFKFKDYMANVFHAIRGQSGIDEAEYMVSIAGDFNYIEFIANSKSGQFFFYSHDGRYMIKTQTKDESKLLRRIMPQYVAHLARWPKSLLVRFYGMHRVKMSSVSRAPIYFVVMSSVFNSDLPIHVKYDIKGSTVGRLVSPDACSAGKVQKDLNLMQSGRTLRLGPGLVDIFLETLSADAFFLRMLHIMDYSLLIGIHEIGSEKEGRRMSGVVPCSKPEALSNLELSPRRRRGSYLSKGDQMFTSYHGGVLAAPNPTTGLRDEVYFFGIIDILQLYNSSKRVETLLKSITNKTRELSSVDPDFYAMRFISFISDRTDFSQNRTRTAASSISGANAFSRSPNGSTMRSNEEDVYQKESNAVNQSPRFDNLSTSRSATKKVFFTEEKSDEQFNKHNQVSSPRSISPSAKPTIASRQQSKSSSISARKLSKENSTADRRNIKSMQNKESFEALVTERLMKRTNGSTSKISQMNDDSKMLPNDNEYQPEEDVHIGLNRSLSRSGSKSLRVPLSSSSARNVSPRRQLPTNSSDQIDRKKRSSPSNRILESEPIEKSSMNVQYLDTTSARNKTQRDFSLSPKNSRRR